MRNLRILFALQTLSFLSFACGLTDEPKLEILMLGVYEYPGEVSEGRTPDYQDYVVTAITGMEQTSGEIIDFMEEAAQLESPSYRIIDRPQKIFSIEIGKRAGQIIQNLTVSFDRKVTGSHRDIGQLELNLENNAAILKEPLELARGRHITLELKVRWRNTIQDEEMLPPRFELKLK